MSFCDLEKCSVNQFRIVPILFYFFITNACIETVPLLWQILYWNTLHEIYPGMFRMDRSFTLVSSFKNSLV